MMWSWFHDPISDFAREPRCDSGLCAVVLQGDNASFGIKASIGVSQTQPVGKFQWQCRSKQHLVGCAELDNRTLAESIAGSSQTGKTDRNPNRSSPRKELGQLAGCVLASGGGSRGSSFGHVVLEYRNGATRVP